MPRTPCPFVLHRRWTLWTAACAAAVLAGCASAPRDGPPRNPPPGLAQTPDAEPRVEAIRVDGGTSRPYTVAGRSYVPLTDDRPLVEQGLASWYGQGFHARATATGEPYDMYAMTAAHRTMPLPSYARVRNPANGREVIVRVNDRGPFRDDRIIDLSYTAALRLDLLRGVAPVEVERLTNESIRTGAWRRPSDTRLAAAPATAVAGRPVAGAASAAAVPMAYPVARSAAAGRSGASASAAAVPVPVPAAWAQPIASGPSERASAPAWQLAQATSGTASDAGPGPAPSAPPEPPPRFRSMEVAPIAPMAPLTPPSTGASSGPSSATSVPAGPANAGDAAAAPAGAPSTPMDARAAGVWMQLGAFREREGAQTLLARVAAGEPALAGRLRIVEEGGAHKVQAGPYPTRDAAQAAVAPLRASLGLAPFAVERR